MDRLDAMTVFVAIVDAGSLSAAGRSMGVPLATVSRKLSDLEDRLKTRLLVRSTRQLALTDAGRDYLAACREILLQVDEAEMTASGAYANAKGELVVSAPIVFGRLHILPVLANFLRVFPEITVRLLLSDRFVNLYEDHVDAALRIGELPDSGLVAAKVGVIHRVVCGSPAYLSKRGTPATPDALSAHDGITFEGAMASVPWTFESADGLVRAPIRPRLSVTTADAAISAAEMGLGLTRVLSYQVAQSVADGRLQRVLKPYEVRLPVHLVHSGQGRLPMKLRAFLDFVMKGLRERSDRY